jgi:hypothetical protein
VGNTGGVCSKIIVSDDIKKLKAKMSNSSGDILILSSNSVMFNFFKRNKENSQADTIRTDDSNECSFILFNANKICASINFDFFMTIIVFKLINNCPNPLI